MAVNRGVPACMPTELLPLAVLGLAGYVEEVADDQFCGRDLYACAISRRCTPQRRPCTPERTASCTGGRVWRTPDRAARTSA